MLSDPNAVKEYNRLAQQSSKEKYEKLIGIDELKKKERLKKAKQRGMVVGVDIDENGFSIKKYTTIEEKREYETARKKAYRKKNNSGN
jgi:hypothetical protein